MESSLQSFGAVRALKRRALLSWSLVVSYLLAVGLTGLHNHREAVAVPHAQKGCEDRGVHLANHPDAPDLCCRPDHCIYCESRAPALPIHKAACVERLVLVAPNVERAQGFRDLSPTAVRSCRAPPERA